MMDEQWIQTFREEIGTFTDTISAFQQGELDK